MNNHKAISKQKVSINKFNIPIINDIRGVAALSVSLFHFICSNLFNDYSFTYIFDFGRKGVQIFFIVSSIVIPLSMIKSNYKIEDFFNFLKIRLTRIEPPYIVALILGIIYLNIRDYFPGENNINLSPSIKDIILHLGYLIPFFENSHWISKVFWTLAIEFQFYIILALIFPFFFKNKIITLLIILSVISISFFFTNPYFFPYWAPYFGLGIIYALYKSTTINKFNFTLLIALFSIITFLNQGFLDLIIGLSTIFIIHFFKNYSNFITSFLGKISYSLYLTHTILGLAIINFCARNELSLFLKILVLISVILISIITSYIFWRIIESPSHKFSQKIKTKIYGGKL